MLLRYLVREIQGIREGFENKSRRQAERKCGTGRGRSYVAPERSTSPPATVQQGRWVNLPPELLLDIIRSLEVNVKVWPARRDVVCCAAICKSWRATTKEVIRTPEQWDASKLLLTAKKIRRATKKEFAISLVADDFSRAGDAYAGKLRSNFLGTKFVIYDSWPLCEPSTVSDVRQYQKINLKKVYPSVPVGNHKVATVSYELNVLRTRGPRRMQCTMHLMPFASIQERGTAPTPSTFRNCIDEKLSPTSVWQGKDQDISSTSLAEPLKSIHNAGHPLVLKNKAPRWHEQLHCWCLNFKGRVTVASVKNFQLVAAVDSFQDIPSVEQEKVILQFGKIGKDIFTMDYRYPLSAFQAFAICLSSFDTKPACE